MMNNFTFEKIIRSGRKLEFIRLDRKNLKLYRQTFGTKFSKKLIKVMPL